tara:strand:- start:122 stop:661 length:540 start_codon:yes stop_codon:yes gene_type:complete
VAIIPTLEMIRHINGNRFNAEYKEDVYTTLSRDNGGPLHTKLWECNKTNDRHTLRIDQKIVESILRKRGRRGRMGKSRGRPAYGIRHLIRRELMLIFHMDVEKIIKLLNSKPEYKSGKKKDITLVMPNLSITIEELAEDVKSKDATLDNHPVFKRMWAPCICRLLELAWINKTKQKSVK